MNEDRYLRAKQARTGNRHIMRIDAHDWVVRCRLCGKKSAHRCESEQASRVWWGEHVQSEQHQYHFTPEAGAHRKRVAEREAEWRKIFGG